ncbi:sialin-like [Babylonia areolata]|uniref:sialin-like n=1 Tax=Babylonia areolata TaxID=304850 RepID=UPI003FD3D8E3
MYLADAEAMEELSYGDEKTYLVDEDKKVTCGRVPARHVLVVLGFGLFFFNFCLRTSFSVALIAMVQSPAGARSDAITLNNSTNTSSTSTAAASHNDQAAPSEMFVSWDQNTQGAILGAFFYGNALLQVPAGWLAERLGGKAVFGYGVLGTSLLTFLIPWAARAGPGYLFGLRAVQGAIEGVCMPAMQSMWSVWAPVYERTRLAGICFSGMETGALFGMIYSGWVCRSGIAGGWPFVFYSTGIASIVLMVIWMMLVHDTPAQHPRITSSERKYIEANARKRRVRRSHRKVSYNMASVTFSLLEAIQLPPQLLSRFGAGTRVDDWCG